MKISHYPLLVLLILLATTGWGQGFVKYFPPATSTFQDVVNTVDGGYFAVGSTPADQKLYMERTDSLGSVVWTRILSMNGARAIAACTTPDNGFVVLAEDYETPQGLKNIVLKITDGGVISWQTQVTNTLLANGLRDIIATADGQFLAAGDTRDGQLRQNVWLVKLSATGAQLWSKSLGDLQYNEQVSRLLELPNGNIVVSGAGVHDTDRDLFLLKTAANGDLLWEKWYAQPKLQNAHDLVRLSDGGLAVLADTYGDAPTKLAILRTDADGILDYFQESSIGLTQTANPPLNVVTSFTVDDADNFYIPLGSAEVAVLRKMDEFGDWIWSKGLSVAGIPQQIIRTSQGAFLVAGGSIGTQGAFLVKADAEGEVYTNKIGGSIFHDLNDNCAPDNGELPLKQFIVRVSNPQGDVFFQNVADDGTYLMPVSVGDFTVAVKPRYSMEHFWVPCDSQVVAVAGSHQTVMAPPLGLRSKADCPLLDVELGQSFIRRCTTSVLNVQYCNHGNLTATNAYVQITPDAQMTYVSSTVPLTSQSGGVLIFNVPDILPGDCGSFNVTVDVSCDAELGEVLCSEAHIFPDSSCLPPNANWDGSNLVVSGDCNGDVEFRIRNTGPGNMTATSDYVIMEDQIIYMQGKVQLDASEDTLIIVPNPGNHNYYLLAQQPAGHPGFSQPIASVQQCGGGTPASSLLQLPQNEVDLVIAQHCDEVVGSYDPNDKRGFPLGLQSAHFIAPGQELEYMVRFQNTGTDTAFLVVIRDTITPLLDITSLRAGVSSHAYNYSVSGAGVVTFEFPNILLPDSATNEAASHGYVMFRLQQREGLVQGDRIENRAAIYFDYNLPVITATAFHTIGHELFSATVDRPAENSFDLLVFPNPAAGEMTFRMDGLPADSRFRLSLFSPEGVLIRQEQFAGTDYRFQREALAPGVYFFRLEEKSGRIARGKIIVH